ncbi:MAG: adenylyl-sulfate kinase [Patescibacteria group bacterium]|nr:adenylyl-sulfate kinase [Patescibacteria group bacterium]
MVDQQYKQNNNKKGFVLWFTGLSQSGKTTIADKVYKILEERGVKIERLDGDVVRESLTKDLGFTKEDRDKNITRVGFVSKLLSKNGVGVIASFISPYEERRQHLRDTVENFIEVYVSTPIEVCEERDGKGLYKKARAGEIKNFTGISDPYEEPENPEILLKPHKDPVELSVDKVIKYLEKNELI